MSGAFAGLDKVGWKRSAPWSAEATTPRATGSIRRSIPRRDLFLMFSLLLVSGNPAVTADTRFEVSLILLLGILVLQFIISRQSRLPLRLIVVCCVFLVLLVVQNLTIDAQPVATMIGFFMKLVIAFLITRCVAEFARTFVKVMVILCMISIVFYTLDQMVLFLGGDLRHVAQSVDLLPASGQTHIGIYNILADPYRDRNAGMFWEPGAFAGYIVIALLFLALQGAESKVGSYRRDAAVLVATLLSTTSTTAYLALPFVALLHLRLRGPGERSRRKAPLLLFAVTVVVTVLAYQIGTRQFMLPKIVEQQQVVKLKQTNWELTRLGSFVLDWGDIRRRPLTGWGIHEQTRRALVDEYWLRNRMGNGLSGFAVSFGIVGLTTVLVFVWSGLKRLVRDRWAAILSMAVVVLLLNGEMFLNFPAFLALMFVGEKPASPNNFVGLGREGFNAAELTPADKDPT